MTLAEGALDLLFPPMLDWLFLDSCLVLVQTDITAQLAHMPVDVNHPSPEYMIRRGIITGKCFVVLVYYLADRANRHHPGTEITSTPQDRDLGAVGLRSLHQSLDEREEDRTRAKESVGKRKPSR